ncbi:pyridoxamine 5'-phosphate oxidase family protein [Algihabitans albus]|uniref:pyridoxamine 5'-phosphate oxidase family protein n=1 Tax=Algihabitans albus TaxID=2164067 RepID=UPI000E5CF850|nr:pyridoxamine 5'-phosphate oxidase family protein [Algihabitans albus]
MTLVHICHRDDEPDLGTVLENCWHLLQVGVSDRKHGFHLPVLATSTPDEGPDARSVVLRGVDRRHHLLRVHSDARSAKIRQIGTDPRVSFLFYDAAEETQLRVQALAKVHREADAAADAAWQGTRLFSRRCYMTHQPPGRPTETPTSGLPAALADRSPTEEESLAGRRNFTVVLCQIRRLDWLYLSHQGHRAARFTWDDAGNLTETWVQP